MSRISETIVKLKNELPPEVKLVAVSKFHPLETILEAFSAGQRIFAESRPQELQAKVHALENLSEHGVSPGRFGDIKWHFIGHLQTNKLKMVLPYVSMVQSVDSLHLLKAIDSWGCENGRVTDVLLEYHISAEESKQGFSREEILDILPGEFPGTCFRGLMGMASFTDDVNVVRSEFSKIKALFDEIRGGASCPAHFDELSIGMSGDYRTAVECGSTMVRIGTMIFGERQ